MPRLQTRPQPKPAAKPQTAPAKQMSENERQVRQQMAELFKRFDQMKALSAEFGPIDFEFCAEFTKSNITQARCEFAQRAALKQWGMALRAAQNSAN
jgi:hypothetical protein